MQIYLSENYRDILTIEDIAEILRLDLSMVEGLIANGELRYVKICGETRIPKSFLFEYLENITRSRYTDIELHFDNRISERDVMPFSEGDTEMATKSKINQPVMINGEKRWITANSMQEFTDKVIKLMSVPQENGKHSFTDYAWNWYNTYSKPTVEKATATTYKRQLTLHLIPAFDGLAVEEITTDHVQRLFNSMDGAKATKDKAKMVLNQILDSAVEDKILTQNPLKSKRVKVTGKASKATTPYSVEQMRFIVQHIKDVKSPIDRTYLAIQTLHPLRLEEVLGLHPDDIDFNEMTLNIWRAVTHPDRNQPDIKGTKTVDSTRTVGLSALAIPYLDIDPSAEFIFGGNKPLSYTQVRRMCNRIKKDIGFNENITPLRFRTTVLTDLYDQTKDIKLTQEAAGHTTSAMTLKYYVKGRGTNSNAAAAVDRAYSA